MFNFVFILLAYKHEIAIIQSFNASAVVSYLTDPYKELNKLNIFLLFTLNYLTFFVYFCKRVNSNKVESMMWWRLYLYIYPLSIRLEIFYSV